MLAPMQIPVPFEESQLKRVVLRVRSDWFGATDSQSQRLPLPQKCVHLRHQAPGRRAGKKVLTIFLRYLNLNASQGG
jgi:hypothetical protein